MPTTYTHKLTTISADPYSTGLEDGFTTYTSATADSNPIPPTLQRMGLLYTVKTGDEWTCAIPYIGSGSNKVYLYPDDYIEYPVGGGKKRWSKTAFENEWDTSSL